MSPPGNGGDQDDAALERLLKRGLGGEHIDEVSLARMRAAVRTEWQASIKARAGGRRWRWLSGAAAVLLVALAWSSWHATRPAEIFGELQVIPGEIGLRDSRLPVGAHVDVPVNMLIRLRGGGLLRAKAGSALELSAVNEVRLLRGSVYVDAQGRPANDPFAVTTPLGVVRHVGTQFEVACVDQQVRVRVREGSVRVFDRLQLGAGEQVTVGTGGSMRREPFAPFDRDWRWTETPVADVHVEGQSLAFLLRWVARETGRQLEFADDHSAALADGTLLHGSVAGLAPELALRAMLATTPSLEADLQPDRIVVRVRAAPSRH